MHIMTIEKCSGAPLTQALFILSQSYGKYRFIIAAGDKNFLQKAFTFQQNTQNGKFAAYAPTELNFINSNIKRVAK